MLFDDDARVGTGLSLLELELWEFERVFSPFVDEGVSLLDLRVRLSPGMMVGCGARLRERRAANEAPEPETGVPSRLPRLVQLNVPLDQKLVQEYHEMLAM